MERGDINIIVGKSIRHRRLVAGLSQQAVGNHLNVTTQQVQKYETGTNGISCEKLLKLAALFGCSIDDLCSGAVSDASHDPAFPWNPYKVHLLVTHFNRIRSHAVRDKVCGVVRAIADADTCDRSATI